MKTRSLPGVLLFVLLAGCASLMIPTGKSIPSPEVAGYRAEWRGQLEQAETMLEGLESAAVAQSVESIFEPLNDLSILMYNASAKAGLVSVVDPDENMRKAAEEAEQAFAALGTKISLSRPLYDKVVAVNVDGEQADTRRYHARQLTDFRRSGVDKDDATREKIELLQKELVKIGQEFDRNIREDIRSIKLDSPDEMVGLPADYIESHAIGDDGKITITTNYPDLFPFMTYAESDSRRKELRNKSRNRGYPQNIEVLDRLIAKRHELANLLGFDTWANYITENKMIGSAIAAQEFIDKVSMLAEPAMRNDQQQLLDRLLQIDPDATEVMSWQSSYISNLIKKEQYDFDSQAVREYLAYDRVRDGIFNLTSELFGVTYKPWPTEVWHPSVEAYEIWDGDELLGRFYLDMHPRDGKFQHAAAFPIQPGIAGRQLPVASLVCNFPGGDDSEGLMVHGQVSTFLHEFGHLLHFMFASKQRWVELAGFATEGDFIEAPSQMLSEWIWSAESLRQFAINSEGKPIPFELVEKMRAARDFGKGVGVRQQMFYASLSLAYYSTDPVRLNTTETLKELQVKYSPYSYVDGVHFQCNFGHLNGYSAIYYTYMWSQVIAKDLFSKFESEGIMNKDVARAYREFVLEPGGAKPAAELVKNFLGRDYNFDAFENWLTRN